MNLLPFLTEQLLPASVMLGFLALYIAWAYSLFPANAPIRLAGAYVAYRLLVLVGGFTLPWLANVLVFTLTAFSPFFFMMRWAYRLNTKENLT